jgi:hypothetical protein
MVTGTAVPPPDTESAMLKIRDPLLFEVAIGFATAAIRVMGVVKALP